MRWYGFWKVIWFLKNYEEGEEDGMDTARLTELVKIQKKADSSKAVKKEFYDNWLQFIREEGPGEEAFRFLIEGFPFCGMEPFAEYLRTSEDMQKTVIAFLRSSAFGKNSAGALKCALNLLACLMRDVETEFATCAVLMRELPRLAFTKEKQLIKDIGKIFARQMFCVIYAKRRLPSLGNYGLNDRDKNNLVLVFRSGLDQCRGIQMDERERMGADLVAAWIENDDSAPVQPAVSPQVPVLKPVSAVQPAAVQTESGEERKASEEEGWTGLYNRGVQCLKQAYDRMQQDMLKMSAENKGFSAEREKLQAELEKRNEQVEHLAAEVSDRDERLFAADKEKELLQSEITWLKEALEQKKAELSDRIQMSQIAQMDSERQSDQQLKRLGSELGTYYQDIMESEGIPMTAELGEILRDQIKDVFGVLIKHGIRVDQ